MAELLVVGADPLLRERISVAVLGFAPRFLADLPENISPGNIALLRFPDFRRSALTLPRRTLFFAYGSSLYLMDAFEAGACDYLKEPWEISELAYRLARWRKRRAPLRLNEDVSLDGYELTGPAGRSVLSETAAFVLEELIKAAGTKVSRAALTRHLWPHLPPESRNLDIVVSQLRQDIKRVSVESDAPQIRSVRGFGYRFIVRPVLCTTCGYVFSGKNTIQVVATREMR